VLNSSEIEEMFNVVFNDAHQYYDYVTSVMAEGMIMEPF